MQWNRVYQIDALAGVRELPDDSVRTVVTSPPISGKGTMGIRVSGGRRRIRKNMYGTWWSFL